MRLAHTRAELFGAKSRQKHREEQAHRRDAEHNVGNRAAVPGDAACRRANEHEIDPGARQRKSSRAQTHKLAPAHVPQACGNVRLGSRSLDCRRRVLFHVLFALPFSRIISNRQKSGRHKWLRPALSPSCRKDNINRQSTSHYRILHDIRIGIAEPKKTLCMMLFFLRARTMGMGRGICGGNRLPSRRPAPKGKGKQRK